MHTMLRLKNIMVENNIIEADFYPEDCPSCGHVVVDLVTGRIASFSEVMGYGASYLAHARQSLVGIANEETLPTERLIMWY